MADITFTPSELTKYIHKKINQDKYLNSFQLIGEISNHSSPPSGHHYFVIKDDESLIKCVLFSRGSGKENLKDGNQVIAEGKMSIYQPRGEIQFIAETIQLQGEGSLQQKFEKLKAELEAQGLFDASRKREIPKMPSKIGIITSKTGSVLQDIINVIQRRYPNLKLILADTRVQGDNASNSIVESISLMNKLDDIDVIILARGGGSIEDLWPFNEEKVARQIFKSRIPIISAIGHETDFTISDLVSDLRAPTPSAAAEIISPDIDSLKELINIKLRELDLSFNLIIENLKNRFYISMDRIINFKIETSLNKIKINSLKDNLNQTLESKIKEIKFKLLNLENILSHLNIDKVFAKGFFLTQLKSDKSIIKNFNNIKKGDHILISNLNETLEAEAIEIKKDKGE
ncbi:MAG: exodeoxyribonuclease VII large subunit [Dehalococcoidia bacterium]